MMMPILDKVRIHIELERMEKEVVEQKFEVGDIVTGNKGNVYYITSEKMTEGEVVSVQKNGKMAIKVLSHTKFPEHIGEMYDGVSCSAFVLVRKAISEYPKIMKDGFTKIVWNPPFTIVEKRNAWGDVLVKGKTVCEIGDEFDERTGYMLALAKTEMTPLMKRYFKDNK